MANKKLQTLRSLRLALSVLAVILFCLGVVSGILAFSGGKPSAPLPEPPTEATTEAATLPPSETTTGTEAPDPDSNLSEGTGFEPNGIGKADPGGRTPGGNNNPGGNNPAGNNPGGSNPGDANPGGSNPGGANTDGSNPGDANPGGSNPGDANPGGSNPGGANTDGSNPGGANTDGSNPGDANPGGSNPGDANTSGGNPGDANTNNNTDNNTYADDSDTEDNPLSSSDQSSAEEEGSEIAGNAEAVPGDAEAVPGNAGIISSSESEPVTESTAAPVETETSPEFPSEPPSSPSLWKLLFQLSICLLVADLAAIGIVSLCIRDLKEKRKKTDPDPNIPVTPPSDPPGPVSIGTLHCQGRRQYQQDSLGHSIVLDGRGVLAVVADGMGGLRDGDKVSQQVVLRTLELGGALRPGQENGALLQILKTVNEEVNRFLTPDGLYKSGSTVVQVLVSGDSFQWLSVGDSRIYLYRAGYVNQLNRDHDLLQDWMPEILEGRRDMEASRKDPDGRKLTSFIGMGQLKYVDRSLHPIQILSGDRIVLMSDGVYGQMPEEQIAEILRRFPDVQQAAQEMDRCVRATQNPHQDNYTALILGF